MKTTTCPATSDLERFALGNLHMEVFTRVAAHVESCDQCQHALEQHDQCVDPFIADLRNRPAVTAGAGKNRPSRFSYSTQSILSAASGPWLADGAAELSRQLAAVEMHLDRFELKQELGSGTFGRVFRAHDKELDRDVAIKIQRAGHFGSELEIERFLREARSAARLKHPAIVSVYDAGHTQDGLCYLVSELVGGETLADWLTHERPTPAAAASLVAQIADALQYAHSRGVVHRDIKPSNILIDADGRPHITDFGLAKCDLGDTTVTLAGEVLGTPAYMSPEQARGDTHTADARTDTYSLGVILYELLTGEQPFQGNRRMLLLQVLEDEPRSPRRLDEKIPRDLEIICLKSMAKSPGRRYASATEMAADLRRFLRGEPILARPISVGERVQRWSLKNPLAAGLMAALVIGPWIGFWHLSRTSKFFVEQTALDSVRMQAEIVEEVDGLYSEIVHRLDEVHMLPTNDGEDDGDAVLPARFTIEAGKRISQGGSGMRLRLYSDHPFPSRDDGGPQDDFERRALQILRKNPDQTVHEFATVDGHPVLRYARARRMELSCLDCHNNHPETPKQDWQEGDLRGVMSITWPLERDIARTRAGLRGAVTLMASVCVGTVVLILGATYIGRRHLDQPDR